MHYGSFTFFFCVNVGIGTVISAINGRLDSPETQHTDECESALEALGQIGSCKYETTLHLEKSF